MKNIETILSTGDSVKVNGTWTNVDSINVVTFTTHKYGGSFQFGHVDALKNSKLLDLLLTSKISISEAFSKTEDVDALTSLIDHESCIEYINDEYVVIDVDALMEAIPKAVFEDSYGDGKAYSDNVSFAKYSDLAEHYGFDISDFTK